MEKERVIKNKQWLRDELGWYWVADLLDADSGKPVGVVGNYYLLNERLNEKPEEE